MFNIIASGSFCILHSTSVLLKLWIGLRSFRSTPYSFQKQRANLYVFKEGNFQEILLQHNNSSEGDTNRSRPNVTLYHLLFSTPSAYSNGINVLTIVMVLSTFDWFQLINNNNNNNNNNNDNNTRIYRAISLSSMAPYEQKSPLIFICRHGNVA